ncbi:MAG: hypothetical protein ACOYXB_11790 [Bacteroidota bacterium]
MKRTYFLAGLVFIAGLLSCGRAGSKYNLAAAVDTMVTCSSDPANSYEIYIPQRGEQQGDLPLLVILDPHGNGRFTLEKFRAAADSYGLVLVASNMVRNNMENYAGAIRTLINDVKARYPAGEQIFLAGFSGGARMALGYALVHPVNGLLLSGALAGPDQITALGCPVYSLSGTDDFNFMETAQYLAGGQTIPEQLKIELVSGSHSWPDSSLLEQATGFLYFASAPGGHKGSEKAILKELMQEQQQRIDELKQKGDLLGAAMLARNCASTEPFKSEKVFERTYRDLIADPAYARLLKQLEKSLNYELGVRQPYLEAIRTRDSLWWNKEITSLDDRIAREQDPMTRATYQRIRSFLGIACFSLCRQAAGEKDQATLNRILHVYRILEPDNPDVIYYSAFPLLWKGRQEAAVAELNRALEAGFTDMARLRNDFPGTVSSMVGKQDLRDR